MGQKKLDILRIQILKMKICRKSKNRDSKDCTIPMKDAKEESVVEAIEHEEESEMSISEYHSTARPQEIEELHKQSPIPEEKPRFCNGTLTRKDTLRCSFQDIPITRKDTLKSGQETPNRKDTLKSGQR